jgi:hypothetical protein
VSGYWFALGLAIVLVVFLLVLLRQRRLKEKYAAIWLALALAVVVVGAFPGLVGWIAEHVGVATPSNLLFACALLILLGVCVQLSIEASTLEEETRTLAEELALLRLDVERLAVDRVPADPRAPAGGAPSAEGPVGPDAAGDDGGEAARD